MSIQVKQKTQNRRRKVAAILAGGLVLGVGATVTLAAWNDSEFASVTLTAGTFNLQGSVDGTTWTDHLNTTEEPAAALEFEVPLAENLSPGDVVYAPFALRLDATTSATLTATDPAASGANADNLTFDAVSTDTFGCDATSFADGGAVPTSIADEETVNLCLQVTAGAALEQGASADVLWQWSAESTS